MPPDTDFRHDPVVAPRTWDPEVTIYRNIRSQIVHIVAVGGAESFSCGVRISSDFEQITESPYLEIRKCKRCALAKLIKLGNWHPESGLKKLRTER